MVPCDPTIGEPDAMAIVWLTTPLPTPADTYETERPPADPAFAGAAAAPRPTASENPATTTRRTTANHEHDACDIPAALPTPDCGG